jgi:hypothetical protein
MELVSKLATPFAGMFFLAVSNTNLLEMMRLFSHLTVTNTLGILLISR